MKIHLFSVICSLSSNSSFLFSKSCSSPNMRHVSFHFEVSQSYMSDIICDTYEQYLGTEVIDGGEEGGVIPGYSWSLSFIKLSDLQLQLPVGCLQGAHLHTQNQRPTSANTLQLWLISPG